MTKGEELVTQHVKEDGDMYIVKAEPYLTGSGAILRVFRKKESLAAYLDTINVNFGISILTWNFDD